MPENGVGSAFTSRYNCPRSMPDQKRSSNANWAFLAFRNTCRRWKIRAQDMIDARASKSMTS